MQIKQPQLLLIRVLKRRSQSCAILHLKRLINNFLQIEKIDMEATLKSKEYLQRLIEPSSNKLFLDPDPTSSIADYELEGVKIEQNFSFLSKVIPAFIYKHFSRFGLDEMKTFYYNYVLKYSVDDIKEISYSMYNSINDPNKIDINFNQITTPKLGISNSIIDKPNFHNQDPISEGILYRLIESPV
jgi:hypothetical protein